MKNTFSIVFYRSSSTDIKYLLREVLGDRLPKHVRERKKKTGWSSPWNNNINKLQDIWHRQDLDFLDSL